MNISELKQNPAAKLIKISQEMGIDNLSRSRKQDIIFAILKDWNLPVKSYVEDSESWYIFFVERNITITTKIVEIILIRLHIKESVLDLPERTSPKLEIFSANEPKLQYKIVPGTIPNIPSVKSRTLTSLNP